MNNDEEVHCLVSGKVQGVFYRDYVAKHARHLALTGYVKNTQNFMVEIVAQGYKENLEKFLEHVRKGPFLARVSRVDVEWRVSTEHLEKFKVVS